MFPGWRGHSPFADAPDTPEKMAYWPGLGPYRQTFQELPGKFGKEGFTFRDSAEAKRISWRGKCADRAP